MFLISILSKMTLLEYPGSLKEIKKINVPTTGNIKLLSEQLSFWNYKK